MRRQGLQLRAVLLLASLVGAVSGPLPAAWAPNDGGDQFLDGIGDTALIARYVLDGSTADRSRNGFKATLHGTGATYVRDSQFGTVLSLPGTGGAFLQIPGEALEGVDGCPVTTTTGCAGECVTTLTAREMTVPPAKVSNSLFAPYRDDIPAAKTIAATMGVIVFVLRRLKPHRSRRPVRFSTSLFETNDHC